MVSRWVLRKVRWSGWWTGVWDTYIDDTLRYHYMEHIQAHLYAVPPILSYLTHQEHVRAHEEFRRG